MQCLHLTIRQAKPEEALIVSDILNEAAEWLVQRGTPLWKGGELAPEVIAVEVRAGLFFLAEYSGIAVATVKFQLEDPVMWPDVQHGDAAYIHRLAVRREFAGRGLSTALMRWAVERTQLLGRRYLRLDTEASRLRLRAVYEAFGFRHHSDRQVDPYFIARYEYDVTNAAKNSDER